MSTEGRKNFTDAREREGKIIKGQICRKWVLEKKKKLVLAIGDGGIEVVDSCDRRDLAGIHGEIAEEGVGHSLVLLGEVKQVGYKIVCPVFNVIGRLPLPHHLGCTALVHKFCAHKGLYMWSFPLKQKIRKTSQTWVVEGQGVFHLISLVKGSFRVLHESSATSIFHCQPFYFDPLLISCILVRAAELQLGSKVRGICFYAVNASTALFLFMLMLVVHPFVLLVDRYRRTAHHLIAKIWALSAVTPFLKIEFEGLENLPPPNTPAVYVSNHQSFLDIYALLTLGRSFKFISKTAIFLIPVIGWAMYLMGLIPLKRMDSRSHMASLKRCMDLVKKGGSVFFFPEGTRSKDGKLGDFKKGAFSIAAKARVPVVPITLIGTGKIMPAGMESTLNPGLVKVIIHQPVEGNNADILCSETRTIIAEELIRQAKDTL
ncbi:hypothetical protein RJ639_017060 [Escallonia herrerae]|uniref:1-acyl-sn-glycerol-3-phosphate acyltransferase n=1 Tax=Escallonia herrerae TaxID=1293975 RepID=A0AA88VGR1_9ASTE|nr:hypothetical protein RJ639_017060 [Escallonia herrerae]